MTKLTKAPEAALDAADKTSPGVAAGFAGNSTAATPAEDLPSGGGCWIRMPDGSLVRDRAEHPEEEA